MKLKTQLTALATTVALTTTVIGCGHGATRYTPQLRARGELVLSYDDGFTMEAEGREIASSSSWSGLRDYVECVPKAEDHADSAEYYGSSALGLTYTGAIVGLAGLGGLSGIYFFTDDGGQDYGTGAAVLLGGLALSAIGFIMAAVGKHHKTLASGHALDAMNYYNDAVGSRGGTCASPPPDLPEVEPSERGGAQDDAEKADD